ncbi:MAG: glycosyl hydrolase family 18 protein [Bacillota bacterium]
MYQPLPTSRATIPPSGPLWWYWLIPTLLFAVGFSWLMVGPNLAIIPPDPKQNRVILGGYQIGDSFLRVNGEILLPLAVFQKHLDPNIHWDEVEKKVVVTTTDRVITMATDQLTAYVNNEPVQLQVPLQLQEGNPYIPIAFFAELYGLNVFTPNDSQTIIIDRFNQPVLSATVKTKAAPLRIEPNIKAPAIERLTAGEPVSIYKEDQGWFWIRTNRGNLGYIAKNHTHLAGITVTPVPPKSTPIPWKPVGNKISLVWEYVGTRNPDPAQIGQLPGVNVVSPTWFKLSGTNGNVSNGASHAYVQWAKQQGYQVWALFSNDFTKPDDTSIVLRSSALREKVIKQVLVYAKLYHLDGINIDFENMNLADKPYFTQFVRELAPLLREQGLTVSVDVTFKSNSENWSLVYDRPALAAAVDYVAVMAYDEHWAKSPVAGPVASIPWVERGLKTILKEIPADKLLLGIPFYTRMWEIKTDPQGNQVISSRALSMAAAERAIKNSQAEILWDSANKLNYAEFVDGSSRFKIWIEDEIALLQRLELARSYGLAGVAAWRRGFEKPDVWDSIATALEKRPYQKPLDIRLPEK